MPDTLGYRKRIGLVVPSTNTTVQPETEALRVPGVTCHTGRVTIKERPLNTEEAFYEHMQMMRDGMGTAIDQIMTAGLDHLIMGIALESFWGGVAAADKLQADLAQRAGVGISMGSTASVAALKQFGSKKIAILTPHQPRGDEMVRAYFVEAGFDVVRLKGLKCTTPRLIAQVPSQDIRNALRELDGDDVDALLTLGTALPAARVAAEAERWLGKPVLAVNVVSYLARDPRMRHRGPRPRPRADPGGVLAPAPLGSAQSSCHGLPRRRCCQFGRNESLIGATTDVLAAGINANVRINAASSPWSGSAAFAAWLVSRAGPYASTLAGLAAAGLRFRRATCCFGAPRRRVHARPVGKSAPPRHPRRRARRPVPADRPTRLRHPCARSPGS